MNGGAKTITNAGAATGGARPTKTISLPLKDGGMDVYFGDVQAMVDAVVDDDDQGDPLASGIAVNDDDGRGKDGDGATGTATTLAAAVWSTDEGASIPSVEESATGERRASARPWNKGTGPPATTSISRGVKNTIDEAKGSGMHPPPSTIFAPTNAGTRVSTGKNFPRAGDGGSIGMGEICGRPARAKATPGGGQKNMRPTESDGGNDGPGGGGVHATARPHATGGVPMPARSAVPAKSNVPHTLQFAVSAAFLDTRDDGDEPLQIRGGGGPGIDPNDHDEGGGPLYIRGGGHGEDYDSDKGHKFSHNSKTQQSEPGTERNTATPTTVTTSNDQNVKDPGTNTNTNTFPALPVHLADHLCFAAKEELKEAIEEDEGKEANIEGFKKDSPRRGDADAAASMLADRKSPPEELIAAMNDDPTPPKTGKSNSSPGAEGGGKGNICSLGEQNEQETGQGGWEHLSGGLGESAYSANDPGGEAIPNDSDHCSNVKGLESITAQDQDTEESESIDFVDRYEGDDVGLPLPMGAIATLFNGEEDLGNKNNFQEVQDETETGPLHPSAMEDSVQLTDEMDKFMSARDQVTFLPPPVPFTPSAMEDSVQLTDEMDKFISTRDQATFLPPPVPFTPLEADGSDDKVRKKMLVTPDIESNMVPSSDARPDIESTMATPTSDFAIANQRLTATDEDSIVHPPNFDDAPEPVVTLPFQSRRVRDHLGNKSSTNSGPSANAEEDASEVTRREDGPASRRGSVMRFFGLGHGPNTRTRPSIGDAPAEDSMPDIPTAFAVNNEVVIATPLEPPEPEEPPIPMWKQRRIQFLLAAIFAVVVALSAALGLSLAPNDAADTKTNTVVIWTSSSPSSSQSPLSSQAPSATPSLRPIIIPSSFPSPSLLSSPSSAVPSLSSRPSRDCEKPKNCKKYLLDQIYAASVRVGTTNKTLADPNSAQSRAREWILEECDAAVPIDTCKARLNEQRYALAVMYFSLGGDNWNLGRNPFLDKDAGEGTWLSRLNHCDWGVDISRANERYNQLVCDRFGNVLNLNLQSNNMRGTIPPEIGVLVHMTSYLSFFNDQSGPIPTSLGLIAPLQTFDVESNNMGGELFQREYSGPDGLTEVINFGASRNNFEGTIPTEIGRWSKLRNLWFADNKITGSIPSEVGYLVDMNAFLFYFNPINGTIPSEIGNLNKLTWIDMEGNQISGTIPEELYSNLDLEDVILKNNSLSGTISDKVGDLTKLDTFWASFNQFSGTIPSTFGNCLNLEELELQNNNLTGSIPEEFGNMESIEFLSVESNKLVGTIPPGLFGENLASLRVLRLNDNQLTGPVPEDYGQSPRLRDLWLDGNLLTGTLPMIADADFLFLEELRINNNNITGKVDESLCLIRNDTIPGGNLSVFHADCQPPADGGVPQIACSCCTDCFV